MGRIRRRRRARALVIAGLATAGLVAMSQPALAATPSKQCKHVVYPTKFLEPVFTALSVQSCVQQWSRAAKAWHVVSWGNPPALKIARATITSWVESDGIIHAKTARTSRSFHSYLNNIGGKRFPNESGPMAGGPNVNWNGGGSLRIEYDVPAFPFGTQRKHFTLKLPDSPVV